MGTWTRRVSSRVAAVIFAGACLMLGAAAAFEGLWVLAGLAIIGLLAVAASRPLVVLIGLILYMPLEGLLIKLVPDGVSGVLSVTPEVLLLVCAVSAIAGSSRRSLDRSAVLSWVAWIGAFIGWGLVSAYIGHIQPIQAVYWLRTVVRYMPAALVVATLVGRREFTLFVAPAFAASIVVQAVIGVIEFVVGPAAKVFFFPGSAAFGGLQFVDYGASMSMVGVTGTLGFYNNYALYAAMCLAISLGALHSCSEADAGSSALGRLHHVALRSAPLAAVVCIMLSGSRQGIVVFLGVVVAMVLLVGVEGLGGSGVVASLIGISLVAAALLSPELTGPLAWLPERFGTLLSGVDIRNSLQTDRLFAVVRVAPAVLAQSPVFGVGPGALSAGAGVATVAGALSLTSEFVAFVQDVGWVAMLVQLGLGGLALVVGLLGWLFSRARSAERVGRLGRGESAAVIGCLAVVTLGMFLSSVLLIRPTSLALWCVAGLCLRSQSAGSVDARPREVPDS